MNRRAAAWVAWSVWAVAAASALVALLLPVLVGSVLEDHPPSLTHLMPVAVFSVSVLGYVTVGAVVVARQPKNAIGWILCAVGLFLFQGAVMEYAGYTLVVRPGGLPAGPSLAWIVWLARLAGFVATCLFFTFTLLLFPDGRLPSPRWRPIAWLAGAAISAAVGLGSFTSGPLVDSMPSLENPLGICAPQHVRVATTPRNLVVICGPPVLGQMVQVATPVLLLGLPALSVTALVIRVRRARGAERQQLKWVALAPFAFVALVIAINLVPAILDLVGAIGNPEAIAIRIALSTLPFLSFPAAIGIAILKHRLFDIDLLIKRTLVYGVLSITLAAAYFAGVLVFQSLLGPLTQGSQLSVAGSTLVVAGVFQPARSRIQAAFDRVFYRRKYDAQRTLDAFGTRLREQVDLAAMTHELRAVVRQTVQPAHVSLWLRPVDWPGEDAA